MSARHEEQRDHDGETPQERKIWTQPKLFRMPHALARNNNSTPGPFGDGAFLYS